MPSCHSLWSGSLVRSLRVLALLPLMLGPSAAGSGELPERVGIRCDLILMGKSGNRQIASKRIVLEPGMLGSVNYALPARSTGRPHPMTVELNLATGETPDGRLMVKLDGEVTVKVPDDPETWQIQRQVEILMGTSALVEVGPPDADGQRLALSLTAEEAAVSEAVDATRLRVDLNVEVAVVEGEEERVLEHPQLRSLSGETVAFGVDYQVPSVDGRTFENVHLDLELTPGFLRGVLLPLQIAITGGFPGEDAAILSSRGDRRLLASGEIWEMAIRPPNEQDPWLRIRNAR